MQNLCMDDNVKDVHGVMVLCGAPAEEMLVDSVLRSDVSGGDAVGCTLPTFFDGTGEHDVFDQNKEFSWDMMDAAMVRAKAAVIRKWHRV